MNIVEKMLKDKVAVITGSGRGIGRAAAILFFTSPLTDYVSGQVLLVSGGLAM
jgi:NAD(P)-dependent dehydrogenase (short-subunit alcohol dehydrogenase family)